MLSNTPNASPSPSPTPTLIPNQVAERAALAEVLRVEEKGLHAANDTLARAARLASKRLANQNVLHLI